MLNSRASFILNWINDIDELAQEINFPSNNKIKSELQYINDCISKLKLNNLNTLVKEDSRLYKENYYYTSIYMGLNRVKYKVVIIPFHTIPIQIKLTNHFQHGYKIENYYDNKKKPKSVNNLNNDLDHKNAQIFEKFNIVESYSLINNKLSRSISIDKDNTTQKKLFQNRIKFNSKQLYQTTSYVNDYLNCYLQLENLLTPERKFSIFFKLVNKIFCKNKTYILEPYSSKLARKSNITKATDNDKFRKLDINLNFKNLNQNFSLIEDDSINKSNQDLLENRKDKMNFNLNLLNNYQNQQQDAIPTNTLFKSKSLKHKIISKSIKNAEFTKLNEVKPRKNSFQLTNYVTNDLNRKNSIKSFKHNSSISETTKNIVFIIFPNTTKKEINQYYTATKIEVENMETNINKIYIENLISNSKTASFTKTGSLNEKNTFKFQMSKFKECNLSVVAENEESFINRNFSLLNQSQTQTVNNKFSKKNLRNNTEKKFYHSKSLKSFKNSSNSINNNKLFATGSFKSSSEIRECELEFKSNCVSLSESKISRKSLEVISKSNVFELLSLGKSKMLNNESEKMNQFDKILMVPKRKTNSFVRLNSTSKFIAKDYKSNKISSNSDLNKILLKPKQSAKLNYNFTSNRSISNNKSLNNLEAGILIQKMLNDKMPDNLELVKEQRNNINTKINNDDYWSESELNVDKLTNVGTLLSVHKYIKFESDQKMQTHKFYNDIRITNNYSHLHFNLHMNLKQTLKRYSNENPVIMAFSPLVDKYSFTLLDKYLIDLNSCSDLSQRIVEMKLDNNSIFNCMNLCSDKGNVFFPILCNGNLFLSQVSFFKEPIKSSKYQLNVNKNMFEYENCNEEELKSIQGKFFNSSSNQQYFYNPELEKYPVMLINYLEPNSVFKHLDLHMINTNVILEGLVSLNNLGYKTIIIYLTKEHSENVISFILKFILHIVLI